MSSAISPPRRNEGGHRLQCARLGGHVPHHLPASAQRGRPLHTILYSRETLRELLRVADYKRIRPYAPRVRKIARTLLRLG